MKKANIIEKTFLLSWPFAIITSTIIFLITWNFDNVVSYLLGVFSVMLMQSLNYRIMKNLYKNNPKKIKSMTIIIYLVKYIFFGIILYVANSDPDWNVFYTFAGLVTYRFVMFPVALIYAKKGEDEDA
ncbi:MAG TPA: ATP synthase subunit I [Bacillota bacterium]|nr:ATP synthase subunit I [Bacillota bacterium]HPJ24289.1 ATP synthase subunit I [Bacillota bacterium]